MFLSKLAVLLAALQLLFIFAESIAIGSDSCVQEYQATLRKAASIRETCESAAVYDCCQAKDAMHMDHSAIFEVANFCGNGPFVKADKMHARCDMDSDGGGWMVIQRLVAGGTENFTRSWKDYEEGFGSLSGNFWYGLRHIHCLTCREEVELRIDMKYANGTELTWTYQLFQVAGPEDKYRLQIGSGVGEGYDAMRYHNGSLFSTYDQDNDDSNTHCASMARKIGWWYRDCYKALLNDCLWNTGSGSIYVPFAEMKIRPKVCAISKHKCN